MATPKDIAAELMSQLQSGKLTKIGIEEVRSAITASGYGGPYQDRDRLETAVLRALINAVG